MNNFIDTVDVVLLYEGQYDPEWDQRMIGYLLWILLYQNVNLNVLIFICNVVELRQNRNLLCLGMIGKVLLFHNLQLLPSLYELMFHPCQRRSSFGLNIRLFTLILYRKSRIYRFWTSKLARTHKLFECKDRIMYIYVKLAS